jgi:hypothetical protein
MRDRICAGTMLIKDGTPTPETLVIETKHYSAGWSSIMKSSSAELGRGLERAGWTFFYMTAEIRTSGLGVNDQSGADRAMAHVMHAVKRQKCNCLEITQIKRRSHLGLSYTSLVAHARHIKRSRRFEHAYNVPASGRSGAREWSYNQPATVASKSPLTGEDAQAWENEGGSLS